MRKHRCAGGVKVARFPGMSEVSGSIPVSGLCFLLICVVFTLCLPCYSHVQLSVVLCPRPRALLIPNLNPTSPPALHLRSYNNVHLCVIIVGQCMRKHRCPGGVKVARFPGMSEVSCSIPCQDSVFY